VDYFLTADLLRCWGDHSSIDGAGMFALRAAGHHRVKVLLARGAKS
jgi:hypothetical protein